MNGYDLAEVLREQLGDAAPAEETRDIETITAEIIQLKQDAGSAILGIGDRLIEAKGKLSHGEWLPWLTERVEFSERTATRFMRLAREWRNQTALTDLGATKALTLLALPPEERESFMAENHLVDGQEKSVIDMTSRELEKAIRERDEARKEMEYAQAGARTAEESRAKMEADMKALKELHRLAQESEQEARDALEAAKRDLCELRERPVDVAVQTVVDEEAVEKARAEAAAEMKAKVERAEAAAKKAEEKRRKAEQELEKVRRQAGDTAALTARAANAEAEMEKMRQEMDAAIKEAQQSQIHADPDLALFNLIFGQAQEQISKLHDLMLKVGGRDGAAADKLSNALLALANMAREAAEE